MKNMICSRFPMQSNVAVRRCAPPPPTPPSLSSLLMVSLPDWIARRCRGHTFNGQSQCECVTQPASVKLEPKLSVWQGWRKVQYDITSVCQQISVLLRVSTIDLTTVCNCRECPHMDVRSLGAYSRRMHVLGGGRGHH